MSDRCVNSLISYEKINNKQSDVESISIEFHNNRLQLEDHLKKADDFLFSKTNALMHTKKEDNKLLLDNTNENDDCLMKQFDKMINANLIQSSSLNDDILYTENTSEAHGSNTVQKTDKIMNNANYDVSTNKNDITYSEDITEDFGNDSIEQFNKIKYNDNSQSFTNNQNCITNTEDIIYDFNDDQEVHGRKSESNDNFSFVEENSSSYSDDIIISVNTSRKRRRRNIVSSESDNETKVKVPNYNTDIDIDKNVSSSEDELVSSEDEIKKPKKKIESKQKFDVIVLSSDTDDDIVEEIVYDGDKKVDNKVPRKKYQRKFLSNSELKSSTKNAKKTNNILRKEYSEHLKKRKNDIGFNLIDEDYTCDTNLVDVKKELILDKNDDCIVSVDSSFVDIMKYHQAEGIDFLYYNIIKSIDELDEPGNGCILAHSMGLGKTFQTVVFLSTILTHSLLGRKLKKTLILVPNNVLINWKNEFLKWSSLPRDAYKCYYDILNEWHECKDGAIILCGYEMFRNLVDFDKTSKNSIEDRDEYVKEFNKFLLEVPDIVVCDEAHRLKNMNSALSIAINKIKTKRRICLTGTPMQNNLKEYFTMVNFVRPNLLGEFKEFQNQFINPIKKGVTNDANYYEVKFMQKRFAVLWKLLEHVIHRRDSEFLQKTLKGKEEYILYCASSEKQRELLYILRDVYKEKAGGRGMLEMKPLATYICSHPSILHDVAKKGMTSGVDDEIFNENDDDIILRLDKHSWWREKQLLSNISWNDCQHSSKIVILMDILKQSETVGDKVLVFFQYKETLNYVARYLKYLSSNNLWYDESYPIPKNGKKLSWDEESDYCIITGDTSLKTRSYYEKLINKSSKNSKNPRLVLMTTKASCLGTNFVGANRVVIFESGFNPADDSQALHRVYRMGQKKRCYVYRLLTQGSLEQRLQERQIMKESVNRRLIDKHNIDRHYNDDDLDWYKLDFIHSNNHSFTPTKLQKPNDNLLANIIVRHPRSLLNYTVYDSLLLNKTEDGLTEEEKQREWEEYLSKENDEVVQPLLQNPATYGLYNNTLGNSLNSQFDYLKYLPQSSLQLLSSLQAQYSHNQNVISGINNQMQYFAQPNMTTLFNNASTRPTQTVANNDYEVIDDDILIFEPNSR
uniref:Transcriptional regulator ATRX homolog n=1 Tax=Parastrongyloides trichosuri TaxID=131310 RepID=A0A0N4ZAE4_PARTI